MKAVLQRVKSASVTVDKKLVSEIGKGILVFAAIAKEDTKKDMESMAAKLLKFKMWPDVEPTTENGVRKEWKKNVRDIDGEILCVSQFTLLARLKKGNKPDFHEAADPEKARELYEYFFQQVQNQYHAEKVKNGVFQAMMDVGLVNDGPVGVDYNSDDAVVTLEIDTTLPKREKKPETEEEKATKKPEERQTMEFVIPPELLS